MDEIDRRMIALLQKNARESLAELSRQLGVSRSTLKDRLKRLEQKGIIEGYSLTLNREFKGRRIRAHIMITIEPSRYSAIVGELEAMPGFQSLYAVSGEYDLIGILETDSTEEMDCLIDGIGSVSGVQATRSFIVFSTKFEKF
ncbi:Lrp/AsnC family transcriptional regulator [Litorivivens sp.]|uniref:Lrp/AsnC family transcriptional regulator n=1 Tax=Litorivivens sp. TaxID=2020868 RepID=UPI003561B2C8